MGNRKGKDVSTSDLGGGGGGVVVWHLESGVGCCGLGQGKRCLPCLVSCLVQGWLQALMPALLKFILPFQPCPKNRKPASIVFPQDPKIPHHTSQGNPGERCPIAGPEAKSHGEIVSTRDNKTRESPFVTIPCQEQSISPSVLRWTTSGPVPASTPNPGPSAGHARKLSALHATH